MVIGIAQIIWIVLAILGLGITIARHGQAREGKYNFWTQLVGLGINVAILYFGGFFG